MNIIVTLFCAFISLAQCGHPNDKCWKQCDFVDYVAVVKCPATGDQQCSCMERQDDAEDSNCLEQITKKEGTQSWLECHDLAMTHSIPGATLLNTFFRWELKGDETLCYFLSKCDSLPGECVPFPSASCAAGPSTEPCQDEPTPTCAKGTWDDEGFHWSCLDGSGLHTINIYTSTGENIPAETTCETGTGKTECPTWTWDSQDHESEQKIAKARCDSVSGDWVSVPLLNQLVGINVDDEGEDVSVMILPNVKDVVCRCEALTIEDAVFNTPGLSLLCDQAYNPADVSITYDNACTLLCDGHFVMYIECYKGQWMDTSQYPFKVVESDEIKC